MKTFIMEQPLRSENCGAVAPAFLAMKQTYQELDVTVVNTVWDMLRLIHAQYPEERFVFVLDEWDYIFHQPFISEDNKREWYNGYQTMEGIRIYNPRSVVCALKDNQIGNYWTSAGPYDEIDYYVKHNVAAVRDDLALMVAGIPVRVKAQEYAATSMRLVIPG